MPNVLAKWVVLALAATFSAVLPAVARASVSIQVTWDDLLGQSTAAVMATPVEAQSAWENGRIYTRTRVVVDRSIEGRLTVGSNVWVTTMGGVVGKVGQVVEGEAVLTPGQAGLFFLHPGTAGDFLVTARGQGQFPLASAAKSSDLPHLVRSQAVGMLLPPRSQSASPFAADVVHGRGVDDVARDIVVGWDRTHPASKP